MYINSPHPHHITVFVILVELLCVARSHFITLFYFGFIYTTWTCLHMDVNILCFIIY